LFWLFLFDFLFLFQSKTKDMRYYFSMIKMKFLKSLVSRDILKASDAKYMKGCFKTTSRALKNGERDRIYKIY